MPLSINTYLQPEYLHLVTTFTEESAKIFHLPKSDSLKLILACEEVFSYLCSSGGHGEQIEVEIANGGYYVLLKFPLKSKHINLSKFNLTASISTEDTGSLKDMGLLIASRSVERFYISGNNNDDLQLVLIKEKTYTIDDNISLPVTKPLENHSVKTPDTGEIKQLVLLVVSNYEPGFYLQDFQYSGKVVDMVGSGEYAAKIAADRHGTIGAGIFWRWIGSKTVEILGPYVFSQKNELILAQELVNSCISEVAKSQAIAIICRYASPELPVDYFEKLGTIEYMLPDGTIQPRKIYYRQLKEDPGCRVWVNEDVAEFLKTEYSRLFFVRDIAMTGYAGEQRSPNSVFTYQFDRRNNEVTLNPIWDGEDFRENLNKYINVLTAESIKNVFFEIDLARAWQVNLTEELIKNDFHPVLLLPYGGEADILVFQYRGGR